MIWTNENAQASGSVGLGLTLSSASRRGSGPCRIPTEVSLAPQVIVWGNYGRMERKQFMGVARVLLEELDLTTLAVGWYKLFPTSSMVDPATGPLLRQASQLSLESTVGPCGERS